MSTTEPAPASNFDAFVRIDPKVRDRLKEHCQTLGLVMGRWVSRVITAELDAENDAILRGDPRVGGRPSRDRRRPRPAARRQAKSKRKK